MRELVLLDEIPFSYDSVGNVLQIDAAHPNERPAGEPADALHRLLCARPVEGEAGSLIPVLGHADALSEPPDNEGRYPRFLEENLVVASSDPGGTIEERRMSDLEPLFEHADLIVDRHGNETPGYDWAFCHPKATRSVLWMIARLGLERVVFMEAPHWGGRFRQYLGLDLSPSSSYTADYLREKLVELLQNATPDWPKSGFAKCYSALPSITMTDANRLNLPAVYEPFRPLNNKTCEALNLPQGAVSLGADNTRYGDKTGWWSEVAALEGSQLLL